MTMLVTAAMFEFMIKTLHATLNTTLIFRIMISAYYTKI